jgi:hypothetical protein
MVLDEASGLCCLQINHQTNFYTLQKHIIFQALDHTAMLPPNLSRLRNWKLKWRSPSTIEGPRVAFS